MKCPTCQQNVIIVFKCIFCGDIRCNGTFSNGDKGACGSSKSPFGKSQGAGDKKICFICKKGKYQKL